MVLDAASLEAITQEIRTCFLYEDAPDHLTILEQGIHQLRSFDGSTNLQAEYAALMRAAHSLKGGAGIAQFSTLSRLAHKLEDLLQALHQGRVQQQESAYELLSLSVEQISSLIALATTGKEGAVAVVADETTLLPIITALENFLQGLPKTTHSSGFDQGIQASSLDPYFLEAASVRGSFTNKPKGKKIELNPPSELNLRLPVSRLDRMHNTIGELFISYERLSLYHEQLHQVDLTLKKRAAQLNPIKEQVQTFYDQLATPFEGRGSRGEGVGASPSSLGDRPSNEEFDLLEFDQYAKLHSTLQDFQELMVQVQEARADVELINSEFREALATVRQQIDGLRRDLTESRLVSFELLAERFVAAGQTFSQRYNKSVELVVIGKETLIDQVILEQLKIPLNHLLRNAFDHGIETPEERLALDKLPTAKITLSAAVEGNQIAITIEDDGRGIDIQKVYRQAVQMGICGANSAELTRNQILEFLFTPGFSTASRVTDLSGRGVGLDIVRLQVERLQGSVWVESTLGQGTKFTISIPLTLSILPLLLCQCEQRTLAIPSTKVVEIIALSEFCGSIPQAGAITWRERTIPLYPLMQLLPYQQQAIFRPFPKFNQHLGIVLDVDSSLVVIAVDSLLGERELVLKPLDTTVKVPAYVSGCTVLGTGEVVPVLSPDHFGDLIAARDKDQKPISPSSLTPTPSSLAPSNSISTILIVDDSIAFRRVLDRLLSQSGYKVVQCRDGKEALEKLNQLGELFDLVISDIEMPRLDGFALLTEIRSHPQWHSLPVMMLTSRENHRHRQKAMSLGATDYFTKPFRPGELLNAIAALVAGTAI